MSKLWGRPGPGMSPYDRARSGFGYYSGYSPRPVEQQMTIIAEVFPGIGCFGARAVSQKLPKGAEGVFLIPRWQRVASTYPEAVQLVLTNLATRLNRGFTDNTQKKTSGVALSNLREMPSKAVAFQRLGEEQRGCDVLAMPAQFGYLYRGYSAIGARSDMSRDEYGLGAFEAGVMLLTHPNRLQHDGDLWVECPGDRYVRDASWTDFDTPSFEFWINVNFNATLCSIGESRSGSASGFFWG